MIGGTGFVGKALIKYLVKEKKNIIILGRKHKDKINLPPGCKYEQGDYGDKSFLKNLLKPSCEVIDLAHSTVPSTSFQNPLFDLISNVPRSVNLLEVAKIKRVKKIVFVSSGGTVYGQAISLPINEKHPTNPISPYGITKLAIEKYALMLAKQSETNVLIARPSNAYGGVDMNSERRGLIPAVIGSALFNTKIKVYGREESIRDYIHVDDLAAGLSAILQNGKNGEIYNLGTGEGFSNQQIINIVNSFAHKIKRQVNYSSYPVRKFDVRENILNSNKIKKISNWKPKIDIYSGIQNLWNQEKS